MAQFITIHKLNRFHDDAWEQALVVNVDKIDYFTDNLVVVASEHFAVKETVAEIWHKIENNG